MILSVRVKPNSQNQRVEAENDGSLTINLKSSPVEGKANEELIKLLAARFNTRKSQIRIKSGLLSKQKLLEILL